MNDKNNDSKNVVKTSETLRLSVENLAISDKVKRVAMVNRRHVSVIGGRPASRVQQHENVVSGGHHSNAAPPDRDGWNGDSSNDKGDRNNRGRFRNNFDREGERGGQGVRNNYRCDQRRDSHDLTPSEKATRMAALNRAINEPVEARHIHVVTPAPVVEPAVLNNNSVVLPVAESEVVKKGHRKELPGKDVDHKFEKDEKSAKEFKVKKKQIKIGRGVEDLDYDLDPEAGFDADRPVYRRIAAKRRAHDKKSKTKGLSKSISITGDTSVTALANKLAVKRNKLMEVIRRLGIDVNDDHVSAEDGAALVEEFGHNFEFVLDERVFGVFIFDKNDKSGMPRPPVVVFMGHVDHGKTTLLDKIRGSSVASGEAGGITQHIGAYQTVNKDGKVITFLDTPGHEAFSKMRSRGADVTDIVVLVVAADDGVMPQTVEAISHAKAAGVAIVLAINKVDKPGANPEKVIHTIANYDVLDESMGGDVISVRVSGLKGAGIDKLEEAILLVAEMLDLQADRHCAAKGVVIESKLDKQRGCVVTLLVQLGTLVKGDILVTESGYCKVKYLGDCHGVSVDMAIPSMPVEVLGFNALPQAGEKFVVVSSEQEARALLNDINAAKERSKEAKSKPLDFTTLFGRSSKIDVNFIVKADTDGSAQVIKDYLKGLQGNDFNVSVLHSGVGEVVESDISLAEISKAKILAFNLPFDAATMKLAHDRNVEVLNYDVIYHLFDDVKLKVASLLSPIIRERVIGSALVKQTFDLDKLGRIAGCIVSNGIVKRNAKVRLKRGELVIYNGRINTLKHHKENASEIRNGMECGIAFDKWHDIEAGDVLDVYEVTEEQQKL